MVVGPAVIVGPTVVVSSGVSVVTGTVVDPVIVGPVTVVTIDVAPVVAVPVAVGTFVITVPSIVVTVGPTVVVGPSVVITVGPAVVVTVDPVVVIPSVVVGPWSAPEEVVEGSVSTVVSAGVEESVVENRKDLGLRRWRVVGKDRRRCLPRGEVSRACEANGNTGQAFPLSAPPPDPAASLRPAAPRVRERLANP